MKTIEVSLEEWERLVEVSKQQMAYRSPFYNYRKTRWPVVLSTNAKGDGWSFETYGHTPFGQRAPVDGIEFLEEVKREYLAVNPDGGRVFLNTKGAYYKTKQRPVKECCRLLKASKGARLRTVERSQRKGITSSTIITEADPWCLTFARSTIRGLLVLSRTPGGGSTTHLPRNNDGFSGTD